MIYRDHFTRHHFTGPQLNFHTNAEVGDEMRSYSSVLSLGGSVFLLVIMSVLLPIRSPELSCNNGSTPGSFGNQINEIRSSYPVVQFSKFKHDTEADQLRSSKYDRQNVLPNEITSDAEEVLFNDWETGLEALPVAQSDLVVLGTVQNSRALLSRNKKSVFSDLAIRVEHVYRSRRPEIVAGVQLQVERPGGIVRYDNGFEFWFRVSGQLMPRHGKQYLFFLSYDFPGLGNFEPDLYLITAYEIVCGKVRALDRPAGGRHKVAKSYDGVEATVMIEDLHKQLTTYRK